MPLVVATLAPHFLALHSTNNNNHVNLLLEAVFFFQQLHLGTDQINLLQFLAPFEC